MDGWQTGEAAAKRFVSRESGDPPQHRLTDSTNLQPYSLAPAPPGVKFQANADVRCRPDADALIATCTRPLAGGARRSVHPAPGGACQFAPQHAFDTVRQKSGAISTTPANFPTVRAAFQPLQYGDGDRGCRPTAANEQVAPSVASLSRGGSEAIRAAGSAGATLKAIHSWPQVLLRSSFAPPPARPARRTIGRTRIKR